MHSGLLARLDVPDGKLLRKWLFLCLFTSGCIQLVDEDMIIGLIEEALRQSDLEIAAFFRNSRYETGFAVIGNLRQLNRRKSIAMAGKFQVVRLDASNSSGLFACKIEPSGVELSGRNHEQRSDSPIRNSPALAEVINITPKRGENA